MILWVPVHARVLISITGHMGIHLDSLFPLWNTFGGFIRLESATELRGMNMRLQMKSSGTISKFKRKIFLQLSHSGDAPLHVRGGQLASKWCRNNEIMKCALKKMKSYLNLFLFCFFKSMFWSVFASQHWLATERIRQIFRRGEGIKLAFHAP